jgi:DNA repair protein RadC
MALAPEEQFRVIYVDNANRIIKDEVLSEGIEDQTAVYPRKIVRHAILNYATGVLVCHNHPTGQLRPSNADIAMTRLIHAACEALDVRFLDHLIIGTEDKGYFSFRENGML